MKASTIAYTIFVVVASVYVMNSLCESNTEFEGYIATYKRNYNTESEYNYRKAIFQQNKDLIEAENAKGHSYTLAVNQFADLTLEEFKAMQGLTPRDSTYTRPKGQATFSEVNHDSIDWTTLGDVTPVRNQASCGSCWAFSAVAAMESANAVAGKGLIDLSEQQLVDCDKKSSGCRGGEMFNAFQYYQKNGACSRESYPYTARDGTCKDKTCTVVIPPISSYILVEKDNSDLIHSNLAAAPLSLGICAGNTVWQFYSSGVVDSKSCGSRLDHGVLLVGYCSVADAWKVKNSWGTGWGEKGFIRIKDDHGTNTAGICGINEEISRPIL